MNTPLRIVFEGADSSGKTKALNLCREFYEDKAEFAEEASSYIGGPQHDELDPEESFAFQKRVLKTQFMLEDNAIKRAKELKKPLVICDRGTPGGSSFNPNGMQGFLRDYQLTLEEIINRYDLVLILDPIAAGDKDTTQDSNPHRRLRSKEDIMRQHSAIQLAYRTHPHVVHIPFTETFEDKWMLVQDTIQSYLN
tara:strand:+ start:344 stop:928 length:585 start_codon:yes stop_codon:yes gene_type:complete